METETRNRNSNFEIQFSDLELRISEFSLPPWIFKKKAPQPNGAVRHDKQPKNLCSQNFPGYNQFLNFRSAFTDSTELTIAVIFFNGKIFGISITAKDLHRIG